MGPKRLALVTLTLVIPLAMLSWHLVERPALRGARRWLQRGGALKAAKPV